METNETTKNELRALTADDIFPVATIINKIGFKEFKDCFGSPDVMAAISSQNAEAIGYAIVFDIIGIILSNLPACKTELYAFVSSVAGIEDVASMGMVEFADLLAKIIGKEEFKGFIKVVSKFLK